MTADLTPERAREPRQAPIPDLHADREGAGLRTPDTRKAIQLDIEVIWHPNYLEFGCTATTLRGRRSSRRKLD